MIVIRVFDVRGGTVGDRQQFLNAGAALLAFDLGKALAQCIGDDAGHAFPRRVGNRLRQTMGFWILDAEAHKGYLSI